MSRQATCAPRRTDLGRRSSAQVTVADRDVAPKQPLPLSPALRTRQARDLARRLDPLIPGALQIVITDNRAVMISVQRDTRRKIYRARLHHLFVDAPPDIVRLLARYITLGDRRSSRELNHFIDDRQDRIRDDDYPPAPEAAPICTEGRVYDLKRLFDDLNTRYFGGRVDARVSWGREVNPGRSRRSVRVGCYILELNLIRIHPGLDREWIPLFYIEWVLFHEMLHVVHPIPIVNGRRRFHTADFEADERRYDHYALATDWEKRNLASLLKI